jgi:hypothetical protein
MISYANQSARAPNASDVFPLLIFKDNVHESFDDSPDPSFQPSSILHGNCKHEDEDDDFSNGRSNKRVDGQETLFSMVPILRLMQHWCAIYIWQLASYCGVLLGCILTLRVCVTSCLCRTFATFWDKLVYMFHRWALNPKTTNAGFKALLVFLAIACRHVLLPTQEPLTAGETVWRANLETLQMVHEYHYNILYPFGPVPYHTTSDATYPWDLGLVVWASDADPVNIAQDIFAAQPIQVEDRQRTWLLVPGAPSPPPPPPAQLGALRYDDFQFMDHLLHMVGSVHSPSRPCAWANTEVPPMIPNQTLPPNLSLVPSMLGGMHSACANARNNLSHPFQDDSLHKLCEMGYPMSRAQEALRYCSGDLSAAIDHLMCSSPPRHRQRLDSPGLPESSNAPEDSSLAINLTSPSKADTKLAFTP